MINIITISKIKNKIHILYDLKIKVFSFVIFFVYYNTNIMSNILYIIEKNTIINDSKYIIF